MAALMHSEGVERGRQRLGDRERPRSKGSEGGRGGGQKGRCDLGIVAKQTSRCARG